MIVIPRHVCRELKSALAFEWMVKNERGSFAATSISGALTRRQHGLLVTAPSPGETPRVLLAKLDEEIQVEGHVYKLGTNEYLTNVLDPDGFVYLEQVTLEGALAEFVYQAAPFELTKTIWMDPVHAITYIHYRLGEHSVRAQLTLVPLCDNRAFDSVTHAGQDNQLTLEALPNGFMLRAQTGATAYRVVTVPALEFTPLDLWYWRFQLRADDNASTDLYAPGLLRTTLKPGDSCTVIACSGVDAILAHDILAAMQQARRRAFRLTESVSNAFTPKLFAQD